MLQSYTDYDILNMLQLVANKLSDIPVKKKEFRNMITCKLCSEKDGTKAQQEIEAIWYLYMCYVVYKLFKEFSSELMLPFVLGL